MGGCSMGKKLNARTLAFLGLMAALVFATSNLRITIPLPVDKAAIHFGNVCCVLSGLLLGPLGGLASGVGSFFFDLFDPRYASEAFITLFNKFFIGFVAGLISHWKGRRGDQVGRNIAAGVAGSMTYVVLYMVKTWIYGEYVFSLEAESAMMLYFLPKLLTSVVNGVVAVAVAVPLAAVLRKALDRNGLVL